MHVHTRSKGLSRDTLTDVGVARELLARNQQGVRIARFHCAGSGAKVKLAVDGVTNL